MKTHCFGCGVEKDPSVLEISPFAKEDNLIEEPIPPLFVLDVQGAQEFRVAIVCHSCFHKLEPDQWISEAMWVDLNPKVPYSSLPTDAQQRDTTDDVSGIPDVLNKQ